MSEKFHLSISLQKEIIVNTIFELTRHSNRGICYCLDLSLRKIIFKKLRLNEKEDLFLDELVDQVYSPLFKIHKQYTKRTKEFKQSKSYYVRCSAYWKDLDNEGHSWRVLILLKRLQKLNNKKS